MSSIDANKLVFIDEAGFSTAMNFATGWAPVGLKPVVIAPIRSPRLTVIGAIALDGVRAETTIDGSMDGESFETFLAERLGPNLKPGDLVVMDRLRAHMMTGVEAVLEKFGASPLYLPPYSPEYNPIEICWSYLKNLVRRVAPRKRERLLETLHRAWEKVSASLCASWTKHCGYMVEST